METGTKYSVDDRDMDISEKVKKMGSSIRPDQVARLRSIWPDIVKEVGKLEERTGTHIALPRSIEDVIFALAGKATAEDESILKNVDLSVIPLTDDLRKILQDLRTQ